jgi:hypothetical protein
MRRMWRLTVAAFLVLLLLGGGAQAQSARDYLGAWYDIPIPREPGRRVLLHRIEITAVPTLRPPARYSVRIWARCIDQPTQVCDLGAGAGVERSLRGGLGGIVVTLNPPGVSVAAPCRFSMLLAPGYDPTDPAHPDNHKGLDYRITPPAGGCGPGPFSGVGDSLGVLSRTPPPTLRPAEPVAPPTLPRRF